MAGITDWDTAVHDRRFWAAHYTDPELFEITWEELETYSAVYVAVRGTRNG